MMEIQIAKRRRMSFKQAPPMQLTPLQAAQVQLAKRRRMSFKQAPPMQPTPLQSAQVGLPNYTAEEDDKARRRVYLVTFPHPRNALSATGIPLVAPESMSKRALLEKLLAASLTTRTPAANTATALLTSYAQAFSLSCTRKTKLGRRTNTATLHCTLARSLVTCQ
jgi:hypothetical protein